MTIDRLGPTIPNTLHSLNYEPVLFRKTVEEELGTQAPELTLLQRAKRFSESPLAKVARAAGVVVIGGSIVRPFVPTDEQTKSWEDALRGVNNPNALTINLQQETCDTKNLNIDANVKNDDAQDGPYAFVTAKATWNGDPQEATINFFGQGDRQAQKGDEIPDGGWQLDQNERGGQELTITAEINDNGLNCSSSASVTIPEYMQPTQQPTEATIEPTASSTGTAEPTVATEPTTTPNVTPTEASTSTATAVPCIPTDVRAEFNFSGNQGDHLIDDPASANARNIAQNTDCPDTLYITTFKLPVGVVPSNGQAPLDNQQLADTQQRVIPEGTTNQVITVDLPNFEDGERWCQVDITGKPITDARQANGEEMFGYGFYNCSTNPPTQEPTNTPVVLTNTPVPPTEAPPTATGTNIPLTPTPKPERPAPPVRNTPTPLVNTVTPTRVPEATQTPTSASPSPSPIATALPSPTEIAPSPISVRQGQATPTAEAVPNRFPPTGANESDDSGILLGIAALTGAVLAGKIVGHDYVQYRRQRRKK